MTSNEGPNAPAWPEATELADEVLWLLYQRQQPVGLDELARLAGTSRASVSRALEQLSRRGHVLNRSQVGLCLSQPVRLDACLIERMLRSSRVGRHAIVFDEVGSTNDVAFDCARRSGSDGLVVLAESQRAGRGRMGRRWHSPRGSNLLLSVLLVDDRALLSHDAVTIAAGVAVAEATADAGADGRLKWPNDVLVDGAKLAGVLVEARQVHHSRCIVVGIGLNVNAAPPAQHVERPATSLSAVLGHAVDRLAVLRSLLERLDHWVAQVAGGHIEPLRQAWLARCGMVGQRVEITCHGREFRGTVLDVDPMEGLLLAEDSGGQVHLPAEASSMRT